MTVRVMDERAAARVVLVALAAALVGGCDGTPAAPPGATGGDATARDTRGDDTTLADGPAGTVVFRRLNRTEYRSSVRDLFGLSPELAASVAADLPSDDLGYGFDNIASVLSMSPLHLELYERSAERLAKLATQRPLLAPVTLEIEGRTADTTVEYFGEWGDFGFMGSGGELLGEVIVPRAGTWRFEARVFETYAGQEHALVHLMIDGRDVLVTEVTGSEQAPEVLGVDVELAAGRHMLAIGWYNDFYAPPEDRNVAVDWFRLVGPADLDVYAETVWAKVIPCDLATADAGDTDCAVEAIGALATRAFRRPVDEATARSLVALFEGARAEGTPWAEALALPLRAILMAPRFLFKVELQAAPGSSASEQLDGYELATRLSYFLWSTTPDDALLAAAGRGDLDSPEGVAAEVRRMLADPRAQALVDNFGGQWLYIRDIANVFPDTSIFPEFDEALRHAMAEEMRLFFASFLFPTDGGAARPLSELLTASDTFVDARLAEHYGLDVPGLGEGEGFVPVSVAGVGRRGVTSQAGLLTALSTPFRTSIVRRGKWVLSQLLCDEPSPPPPGVEGLIESEQGGTPRTLREKMELHKTEERCVTCHKAMDSIGFALEPFDGIGQARTTDNGFPIDATGELRGRAFEGPVELAAVLGDDPRLPACVIEKVFVYALGRGVDVADEPTLARIGRDLAARGESLPALVELIATSTPFRFRQGVASP